jgi:tetratricopeptide (TPR) repeat protein
MKKIIFFIILLLIPVFAQNKQKVVRLSDDIEAWLDADTTKAMKILLQKEAAGNLDITTLYNIGYLYFLQDNFSKALLYFQTVIVKEPSYPFPYLQIARIHKKIGNIHAARDHLEKGLDEDDENIELLLELADILKDLKEQETLEDIYKSVLNINEDNVKAITGLASLYREQGRYEKAKELLEGNTSIYPEAEILLEKAKLYHALGAKDQSRKSVIQIFQEYPNSQRWLAKRENLMSQYNIQEIPVASPIPQYTYKIDPNEELHYKVKYGPMTLGWMKVRINKPEKINGKTVYPVIFFVDSNPAYGLIIKLHNIYESYIDPVTMNAVRSRLYTPGGESTIVRVYYYEYEKNIFLSYAVQDDGRFALKTKDLPRMVQDATSMLYFSRSLVADKISGVTVVVIDEEYKYGHIDFLNETEQIDVGRGNENALKIFARADFKGIAGMNGEAWGWFEDNANAMPLKGNIEIIIGSISLEVDEDKTDVPNYHEEED